MSDGAGEVNMQIHIDVMSNEQGQVFVRYRAAIGPMDHSMVGSPDDMENWLALLNENLPKQIADARRQEAMRGFQVVQGVPEVFRGVNGQGRLNGGMR